VPLLRILLVDDSALFRSMLRSYLKGLAETYYEASDGQQGISLLEAHPVDLVLADYDMEGMGGLDFVRALRAHPRKEIRTLPTVMVTARKEPDLIAGARQQGVDEVLHKPFVPKDLRSLVQRLVGARVT
jgi:two-component system chemotaxis response regulator CheY